LDPSALGHGGSARTSAGAGRNVEAGGLFSHRWGALRAVESRERMNLPFSPGKVVGLLRQGDPSARAILIALCSEPVGRIVDRLIPRDELAHGRELLIDRALRWVEMYLRARDASE